MSRLSVSLINTSANRKRVCISTVIDSFVFSNYHVRLTMTTEYQQYSPQTLRPGENKTVILMYHLLILCPHCLSRQFLSSSEIVFRQFPQRQMRLPSADHRKTEIPRAAGDRRVVEVEVEEGNIGARPAFAKVEEEHGG